MKHLLKLFPIIVLSTGIGLSGCSDSDDDSDFTPVIVDRTAPVVTFAPSTLTLESENMATATLTATDDVGVTSGPTVTCTNGGGFADDVFTAPQTDTSITVVCTAIARDAARNTGTGTLTVTVNPRTENAGQYGAGFEMAYNQARNDEPVNPLNGDIIPVDPTADPDNPPPDPL